MSAVAAVKEIGNFDLHHEAEALVDVDGG